jgi:hypothetical protein
MLACGSGGEVLGQSGHEADGAEEVGRHGRLCRGQETTGEKVLRQHDAGHRDQNAEVGKPLQQLIVGADGV